MTHKNSQIKVEQIRNIIILMVIIFLGIISLFYVLSSDHSSSETSIQKENSKTSSVSNLMKVNNDSKANDINKNDTEAGGFVNPLDHIDAESIVLEKTQKELKDEKKETDDLAEKIQSLANSKKVQEETSEKNQKTNEELLNRVSALEKQLALVMKTDSPDDNNKTSSMQGSNLFNGDFIAPQNTAIKLGGIREDALMLSPQRSKNIEGEEVNLLSSPLKNPDSYVPAGAFVRAVLLSGADASAAVNSPANPEPMILRILDNGTLPNHTKSHLKDCTLTAAVIGDISSERGKIRLERLSCTFPNHETVEQEVEGTIIGPEGKNGVRGIPVWRDEAMTQRMFTAGFLSGVANGVSNSYNTNSISAQGTVQTLNSGKIFQNGVANGSSKAMDKLSDYYIQRAEQYHPVIQLSAGKIVDVVFLKGFFLDGKKHDTLHDTHEDDISSPLFLKNDEVANSPPSSLFSPVSEDSKNLPLSEDNVEQIKKHSKELGLRVTEVPHVS